MNALHILSRTNRFNLSKVGAHFVDPCCFGEDLAAWLSLCEWPASNSSPALSRQNIVNPFNIFWLRSAGDRASELMAASPSHRDKYLWFLALHEAVDNGQELVPPAAMARFIREGILVRRIPGSTPTQNQ
jgi:hypothetical protein